MRYLFTLSLLFIAGILSAQQGVAINTDGSTPDITAILDVKSTTKGFLLPRMTTAQRNAISNPPGGLIVFDTDRQRVYQSDDGTWRPILNGRYWNRSAAGNYTYNTEDSIGIGTATPDEKLEIVNGRIKLNHTSGTENSNTINFNSALPAGGDAKYQGLSFFTNGNYKAGLKYISSNSFANHLRISVSSSNYPNLVIDEEGHVGIGTPAPKNALEINGTSPMIQLQETGFNRGFVQLSGDNIRIGTNSENTNGKFIVRTGGDNRLTVTSEGKIGINTENPIADLHIVSSGTGGDALRIEGTISPTLEFFSGSTQKGSVGFLGDDMNIRAYGGGLVKLGNELYVDEGLNRIGIGTTTPDEKLHVAGNLKIENGELHKPATGTFNMMPLCYGRINANGTIHTATPNVTVTRTSAGNYEVNCSGITEGSVMAVTVYGSTRYIGSASYVSSGKMLVTIEDIKQVIDDPDGFHANDDKTFYFIIYNY